MVNLQKRNKQLRDDAVLRVSILSVCCLYIGLYVGATYTSGLASNETYSLINAFIDSLDKIYESPFAIWPTNFGVLAVTALIPLVYGINEYENYRKKKNTMANEEYGSSSFNDNILEFKQNYMYDPMICHKVTLFQRLTAPIRFIGRLLGGKEISKMTADELQALNDISNESDESVVGDNVIDKNKDFTSVSEDAIAQIEKGEKL